MPAGPAQPIRARGLGPLVRPGDGGARPGPGGDRAMTFRSSRPARLTPGQVRSMSFRLARLGRRGLDEDDVREFCDQVEEELSLLLEERSALQSEVRRLRGWAHGGTPGGPPGAPPGGPHAGDPGRTPAGNRGRPRA